MTPLHAALAVADAEANPLTRAKLRGLLRGYAARYVVYDIVPTAVEDVAESPLCNLSTGRTSRSFRVMGKIDVRGNRAGRTVLMDHKTCSEDIADPNAPYWRQLIIEGQLSHYMLLEWLAGRKVDEAVWDVVRKPDISPRKLSRLERSDVGITGRYYDDVLSCDDIDSMRATERETPAMYEARLAHDCTTERSERYFQRRTIPRLDAELIEYGEELWDHAQNLLVARREGRWPRNSGACMSYGSPCRYLGICSGYDSPDSQNWRRKDQVHHELPIVEGDGRDVLTNSRIRCWQTCARKHYYDYELGIERAEHDDTESLYFGSAWHLALEAYFNVQKEQYGNATDSAGSELATIAIG